MRICIAQRAARAYPAALFIPQEASEVQVRRLLSVLGVVSILLGATAPAVAAAAPDPSNQAGPPGRILGVVPVLEQGKAGRPSGGGNLTYHGGPTMNTNQTFAIFWGPSGSWDLGYQGLIEQYFGDVAKDSTQQTNVYFSDTQYHDSVNGNIQYLSNFGGSLFDTHQYPLNGCTDKATSICLSDAQLQAEIQFDMTASGWSSAAPTGGESQLILIFTPKGVGSCAGSSCAYTNFCAYHSWIGNGSTAVLYANQPYANQNYRIYTCNSGQWPNGNSADATLNVVSHEHNEAITDQQGSAWYDSQGAENGDKCAWKFGTATGPSGAMYNQTINNNHYYLQQEWSNAHSTCVLQGT
jgi:hypothetical protein